MSRYQSWIRTTRLRWRWVVRMAPLDCRDPEGPEGFNEDVAMHEDHLKELPDAHGEGLGAVGLVAALVGPVLKDDFVGGNYHDDHQGGGVPV